MEVSRFIVRNIRHTVYNNAMECSGYASRLELTVWRFVYFCDPLRYTEEGHFDIRSFSSKVVVTSVDVTTPPPHLSSLQVFSGKSFIFPFQLRHWHDHETASNVHGVETLRGRPLTDIEYVNDVTLPGADTIAMQTILNNLNNSASRFDMPTSNTMAPTVASTYSSSYIAGDTDDAAANRCQLHSQLISIQIIITIDSITLVFNIDASLPYNHDLFDSLIVNKIIKIDGEET
ncbi:hypothetical protein CLF_102761 [Clonorchis sinensis]|uniref:Uncharacterized protein n=1 Tax=Clonorchis sinensis TaxID=79923 RepID=G7Y8G7_CLOSI|nr:hypothetical protein CLF_102761 [Clonorchis sinensis]